MWKVIHTHRVLCVTKYCCNGGFTMNAFLLSLTVIAGFLYMSKNLDKNSKFRQIFGGGCMLGALLSIQGMLENVLPGISQFFGAFMFCWVAAVIFYLFDAHRTATSIFLFGMVFVIGSFMAPGNPDRMGTFVLFMYPVTYMILGLFRFTRLPTCRPLWAL